MKAFWDSAQYIGYLCGAVYIFGAIMSEIGMSKF